MEDIQIYQSEDGALALNVAIVDDSIWLTQQQMADLFDTKRPATTKHIGNIFKSNELDENSVCYLLELTAVDGKNYHTKQYEFGKPETVVGLVNEAGQDRFNLN